MLVFSIILFISLLNGEDINSLQVKAEKGDNDAREKLVITLSKRGENDMANEFAHKFASQGHLYSQLHLALHYFSSDHEKSKYWLSRAATNSEMFTLESPDTYWSLWKKYWDKLKENAPALFQEEEFSYKPDDDRAIQIANVINSLDRDRTVPLRRHDVSMDVNRMGEKVVFQDFDDSKRLLMTVEETYLYSTPLPGENIKMNLPKYSRLEWLETIHYEEPVKVIIDRQESLIRRVYKVRYHHKKGYVPSHFVNDEDENVPLTLHYINNRNGATMFIPYVGYEKINPEIQRRLESDRFAIVEEKSHNSEKNDDFIELYGQMSDVPEQSKTISIFITTDLIYHTFRTLAHNIQKDFEYRVFAPLLNSFIIDMAAAIKRYETQSENEKSARQGLKQIIDVASQFVQGSDLQSQESEVIQEVKRINKAEEREGYSEIAGIVIDYSRFSPRMYYTETDYLRSYWKAYTWLSSLDFKTDDRKKMREFILFFRILEADEQLMNRYRAMMTAIEFLYGENDHYPNDEVISIENKMELLSDDIALDVWIDTVRKRSHDDWRNKVYQLLPQTYNIDNMILKKLSTPRVGNSENPRYPHGYDIPAVMSVKSAEKMCEKDRGEYVNFDDNYVKLKTLYSGFDEEALQKNINMCFLALYETMFKFGEEHNFYFTQSDNWGLRGLLSGLGARTETASKTILSGERTLRFVPQGLYYSEPMINYLEPNLPFFYRMRILVDKYKHFFSESEMIESNLNEALNQFRDILEQLTVIAEKEAAGIKITEKENDLLNSIHIPLGQVINAESKIQQDITAALFKGDVILKPDETISGIIHLGIVHSLQEGKIHKYSALGKPYTIYVALNDKHGGKRIAKGYVYSYYEFTNPTLIDDLQWKEMIYDGEDVDELVPEWAGDLIIKEM